VVAGDTVCPAKCVPKLNDVAVVAFPNENSGNAEGVVAV